MLSWQTIYYYKTGLIFLNSMLEMSSTLSVKSLSGAHTHTQAKIYKKKFTTKFFFGKCSWGLETPHPGVVQGWKTIHFFLWPWPVTGKNYRTWRSKVIIRKILSKVIIRKILSKVIIRKILSKVIIRKILSKVINNKNKKQENKFWQNHKA